MVSDPKDIMLAVHSTLVDFLDEYDMVGWVRANDSEVNTALLTFTMTDIFIPPI